MATLRQTTAFGPGVYRNQPFTRERLRSFVEGTNKAIAAGIPIPLLKKHSRINATDSETNQFANDHGQGAGWVTKVDLGEDGGLVWEAKDVPQAVADDVASGLLKFTSPEFRNHYVSDKQGVYEGPIIRHFSFTPVPGNPHQGPITTESGSTLSALALEETQDAWQFAEFEKEPLPAELQFSEGIEDEDTWEKAKKSVDKDKYKGDSYWAVVSTVYKKMGGKYKHSSQHAEVIEPPVPSKEEEALLAKYAQYEEASTKDVGDWTLPFSDFIPWLQEEATEQFAHKDPADTDLSRNLEMINHHNVRHLDTHDYMKAGEEARGEHHLHQQRTAILSNLAKKHTKGVYDHEKAKKLWGYYAKALSDHLAKHYGTGKANPATRAHLASSLADYHKEHNFEQYEESQQFKERVHGRYFGGASKESADSFAKHVKELGGEHGPYAINHSFAYSVPTKKNAKELSKRLKNHYQHGVHYGMDSQYAEATEEVIEQPLPDINPDMPPKTPDRNKLAAIIAGLAQKNIVVPSDFDFTKPEALDILLGCINSAIKAENETRAEMEPADPDNEPVTDAAMPFAEGSEQFKEPIYIGNGYYFHKRGMDLNGNHAVWVSKGSGRAKKIQTNGTLPKFHRDRELNDHTKRELLSHLSSSQFSEFPDATDKEIEQFGEGLNWKPFEDSETYHSKKGGGSLSKHYARSFHGEYNLEKRGDRVHVLFEHKSSPNQWNHLGITNSIEAGQRIAHSHHQGMGSQHSETQSQQGGYIMQFSEEELAAMPASVKEKLDKEVEAQAKARKEAEAKAAQFAEEKQQQINMTAKEKAISAVKSSAIPPALKSELTKGLTAGTIQFAEGAEVATFTAQQVAEMYSKFIPKHLQFTEEDTELSKPPAGKRQVGTDSKGMPVYAEDQHGDQFFETEGQLPTGHVSAERANELINSSPVMQSQRRRSRVPTVGEDVARMNAEQKNNHFG
jgi:hypothetical protein